MNIHFFRKVMM